MVRIHDRGSKPRRVTVDLQGIPATRVVDSGADITIMGAERSKKVAAVGRLKRSAFKKPDKVPYTYNHRLFALNGKIELDITFDNRTPVYVKMEAHDPLLLSEGVCHQLGIISYHPKASTEYVENTNNEYGLRAKVIQSNIRKYSSIFYNYNDYGLLWSFCPILALWES